LTCYHQELISAHFQWPNGIDKHNQAWQFEVWLEKLWRAQNAWFCLVTTIIGITVTDTWKRYKLAIKKPENWWRITISEFEDNLSYELIHNTFENEGERNSITILSPLESCQSSPRLNKVSSSYCDPVVECNLMVEVSETTVSPFTNIQSRSTTSKKVREDTLFVQLVELHKQVQQESKEVTGRKIRWHCSIKRKTGWHSITCTVYCCPEIKNTKTPRNCYKEHILAVSA
jgi:hypothetical protein